MNRAEYRKRVVTNIENFIREKYREAVWECGYFPEVIKSMRFFNE